MTLDKLVRDCSIEELEELLATKKAEEKAKEGEVLVDTINKSLDRLKELGIKVEGYYNDELTIERFYFRQYIDDLVVEFKEVTIL